MIALSWTVFTLLGLAWTGAAWITAAGTEWASRALASGTAAQGARDVAALPLPDWLKTWADTASLEALQSALRWIMEAAGTFLPFAADAAGWLVPAIWIAWAVGMALLLLVAIGAHMLLRHLGRMNSGRAPMSRMT